LISEAKSLKTTQVRSLDSSPLRLDGCHDGQEEGWTSYLVAIQRLHSLKLKPRENYQAQVHSDQMVLMRVRQEAGPVAWWPKTIK
jgi:hypothetical protein